MATDAKIHPFGTPCQNQVTCYRHAYVIPQRLLRPGGAHAYPLWRSAGIPRMAVPSIANPATNMTAMAGHCRALGR